MAITVTLPISAPTNPSAALQSGGSLSPNTTYYFVVFAYENDEATPSYYTRFGFHSPISTEGSFTTDAVNLSALITWTNSAEHVAGTTRYNILISTISGDYTSSMSYTNNSGNCGTITDGTTGYTVTSETGTIYMLHSAQVGDNLPGNLSKDLGIIKVYIDNETREYDPTYGYKYALQVIYDAIVSAGYSGYVSWDGQTFALKGWIIIDGSNTTVLTIRSSTLLFIRGGLHIQNINAIITFGYYNPVYEHVDYKYTCDIIGLHQRYPIRCFTGQWIVYGGRVGGGMYNYYNPEFNENPNANNMYYLGGANFAIAYDISGFKDVQLNAYIRGVTSEVNNLQFGISNNWHTYDTYDCACIDNRAFAYTQDAQMYRVRFVQNLLSSSGLRMYVPAAGTTFWTNLYDCIFSYYSDNIPTNWYYMTNYGNTTSDSYTTYNYSLKIKVIDADGNAVSGVSIDLKDKDGNQAVWIEHSGAKRAVTGNTYTTPRTTDVNGEIDYYVLSYKVNLAPDNTIVSSYCDNTIKTVYYPFTIILSKTGYADFEITLDKLVYQTNLLIKYTPAKAWYHDGTLLKPINNINILT